MGMETTLTAVPTTTTTTTTIKPTLVVRNPFCPKPTPPILTKVSLLAATALPQIPFVVLLASAASLFVLSF